MLTRAALMYDLSFEDSSPSLIAAAKVPAELRCSKSNSLATSRSISAGGMTSEKNFADSTVMLLIVVAAVTLGNAVRVLLFCGVIIWSLAKLPWICLTLLCRIGMGALSSRILAPLHELSERAAVRFVHR